MVPAITGLVVIYRDGKTYGGATAADVVRRIAEDGILTVGQSNVEYMAGVKERLFNLDKIRISYRDEAEFLEELERHGSIEIRRMS